MATQLTEENKEYVPKAMEHVKCPLCNGESYSDHEIFGHKDQYSYVECDQCSNIYLNPRPVYDEEYLDTAYDQYGMNDSFVLSKGEILTEERKTIEKYKVVLNHLEKKYGKKGKILDLGCATGLFVLAAKELGWAPYGIDISKPMVNHVNENLSIEAKAGQFHELDLSDWGKFDVIYSSHVIEHVPNPNQWMQTFKKYLKEDGILCLNIPNQHAPEKKLQRLLKKIKLRNPIWEVWRTPDHLYEPHIKSIQYLLQQNDFQLLEIHTYSNREQENESFGENIFHKKLKWGSKIRLFAKPV